MREHVTRNRSVRGWIVALFALTVVAIAGAALLMRLGKRPLHDNAGAIASVSRTNGAPQWSTAAERAQKAVQTEMAGQNLPGVSVAVGSGSEVVWSAGFGWADIKASVPVMPDTRFRMGTASTLVTSAGVGELAEKGRLTLDGEILTWVSGFPKKQWPVTLRQLMTHSAGLATEPEEDGGALSRARCERPVEALPQFANSPLLFEPGTQFRHSKFGWILVSAAVEAAAGKPFLEFMEEQIIKPLGMENTGAESAKEENPERVGEPEEDPPFATLIREMILQPLGAGGGKRVRPVTEPATVYATGFYALGPAMRAERICLHAMRLRNLSCYAGAMAFSSTAPDLARFGLAMLQKAARVPSGQEGSGERTVSVLVFRETGMVVVVMSNGMYGDTVVLARKVAEAFGQKARGDTNRL